ncbi:MAG TPA: tetratricopeptide repeat protein [Candidatus Binatia bacterium]|jgi:tetratricopeptide (TPR) repeat protein
MALFFMAAILPAAVARAQGTSERSIQAAIFVDRAVIAYGEKRYQEALKELEEALRLDPENLDALYYQGLVYTVLERPTDARAAFEKARKINPKDIDVAFQLGTLHFAQKEYDRAEPLLREVYRADPKRPNIGYYLGVIEFNKQNFREALGYLKANVPSDDNFAQLNSVYTGVTLARLGALGQAKAEIDQALRLQPASPLTAPAQRFGEILEKSAAADKRFHGQLRLGVFYDTNPAVIPDRSDDPTVKSIRTGQQRQKSEGELVVLDLAYTWLRSADWEGTISHRFLHAHENRLTDFNTQSNTPTLSVVNRGLLPGALGSLPYTAGFLIAYDYISLGNSPFTQRWIVTPYVSISENESNVTTFQYRYQAKDFFHDEDFVRREIRDANNYMVGWTHFVLAEKGRHYLKLGYQYDAELAEGENWSYWGNRLLTGFQYTLPWWEIRFRYDLDFHWRAYKYNNSILPATAPGSVRRRDRQPVHLTGLAKDFLENFTVAIEYLFDQGKSNLAPFDYHRHVVTTSVAWRF